MEHDIDWIVSWGPAAWDCLCLCVQAVIKEKTQQKVVEAQVRLEITDREVERQKKEHEGMSLAQLMAQNNQSEAVRIAAQAEADKIKMMGEAKLQPSRHRDVLKQRCSRARLRRGSGSAKLRWCR